MDFGGQVNLLSYSTNYTWAAFHSLVGIQLDFSVAMELSGRYTYHHLLPPSREMPSNKIITIGTCLILNQHFSKVFHRCVSHSSFLHLFQFNQYTEITIWCIITSQRLLWKESGSHSDLHVQYGVSPAPQAMGLAYHKCWDDCEANSRNNRKSVYQSEGTMCRRDYHSIMTARRFAIWAHSKEKEEYNEEEGWLKGQMWDGSFFFTSQK